MVHHRYTANRKAHQDSPTNLPDQRESNFVANGYVEQAGWTASYSALRVCNRHCRWRSHYAICSTYLHLSNGRSRANRSRSCRSSRNGSVKRFCWKLFWWVSRILFWDLLFYSLIFSVAEHLVAQHVAIKMLHSRIKLVLEYVKDVQEGKLKPNHDILREAFTLSHRLPVVQNPAFKEEFHTQSNDVGLITYLGTLTKASNDINQLVNKFNLLHDRQSRRMRFFF